jgi:phosphatidylinositol alpha-mannosyltransferase
MKIALVSPYDFAHPGGVGSHITSLDLQFRRMGHEVRVIAPASRAVEDFGDRFIPIGYPFPIPSSDSIIRIPISLHLGPAIKKVLARERFDVIHLHEPIMPMLCSAVLRFSDAVNVGTFHAAEGKPGYNWGKPISTWMIKRRMWKLHGKIAVSEPAMNFANQAIPGPFELIPNGIDIDRFSDNVPPVEKYRDGMFNILFVGRLEFRKGLNYLLTAFLRLKQEQPNCRLIVVGPGTRLRRRYERWVRKAGLRDVVFVGYVSKEDLPRYYRTADIYCAPATSRESFGIVLLEAMACKTPVVASNIPGYSNVVTHGSDGLLVPPRNHPELARTLISLIDNETLRREMGEKGRAKAEDYRWEIIAQRVYECYQRTIEQACGQYPEIYGRFAALIEKGL